MPEPKFLSPLMDGLEFGACVQSEGSKSVYLMRDTKTGTVYLLRIFSVPESAKQMDALIYSGAVADRAEALRYYTDQILELRRSLETIKGFSDFTGVQVHTDYQIDQLPEDQGFAVYVLAPYLPTLAQHLNLNAMTMLEALNLGIDLCDALFGLHESGYLVQNVSLENILITPKNRFVLSNLSLANLDRLDFSTIAEDQLSSVSAPELFGLIPSFKSNSDVYALGLVLYYIFNGNHVPFVDEKTTPAAASKRRIDGEALPAPMYADYELGEIILKACAYDPEDRYQGPDEFKAALVQYMQRNPVSDTLIVPPIHSEPEDLLPDELEEEDAPLHFAAAEDLDEDFVAHLSPSDDTADQMEDELLNQKLNELIDEQPPAAAEEDTTEDIQEERTKRRLLAPILSVCAIVICAVILLAVFLRPKPLNVEFLNAADVSATQLTVTLQLADNAAIPVDDNGDSTMLITCSDAYGNVLRLRYDGQPVTFENLTPGTQYAIGVENTGNKKLTGRTSINAKTVAAANVSAITASDLTGDSVLLTLAVNGHTPEQWTITCAGVGLEPLTHTFSGNSIQISGLVSNTTYTCTFEDPTGGPVTGETSVTFTTEPTLTLESFDAIESTIDSVSLAWTYSGDQPKSWTLRCEGSDGSAMEQTVDGLATSFTGLAADVSYTFTISTVGMEESPLAVLQISTVNLQVVSFEAAADDAGSITASWSVDGAEDMNDWNVSVHVSGQDEKTLYPATGNELTITGLIPQTSYTLELLDSSGNAITGESVVYVRTPVAERFTDYGCTNLYTALYLKPEKENWTIVDLATLRKSFSSDEGIVIAIESINGIRSADQEINVLYVIRNAENTPVTASSRTEQWNDLWDGKVLVDTAPEVPEEAGEYTLELYFNGRLLTDYDFTVNN